MSDDFSTEMKFFASLHTSKGVYRQPKIDINEFLESGEKEEVVPVKPAVQAKVTAPNASSNASVSPIAPKKPTVSFNTTIIDTGELKENSKEEVPSQASQENEAICIRAKDSDFASKLEEALSYVTKGLPGQTKFLVSILYNINLIKPEAGQEELWFEVVYYQKGELQVTLKSTPEKVKYLKPNSILKPTLDKIQKFMFED